MANSSLALGSSLNLRRINKSVSGLSQSVSKAQSSAAGISKSLLESNRNKRKSLSLSSTLFRRRREATLRREREDILEAGGVVGAVRRTGKVVMSSTKSFLGRILDFTGTLLIGWAITNLPKIISLAQGLVGRMQKYFGILNDFVGGVSKNLLEFGQKVGEVITNISGFSFSSVKDIFDKSFETIRNALVRMENETYKVIRMATGGLSNFLEYLGFDPQDFRIPGLEALIDQLENRGNEPESEPSTTSRGNGQQQGSAGPYPDPKSAEMYRIAAALTTEGNSDQGYADMMQVLANRKASGYGATYTEILSATGQFAGVEKRGSAAFKSIRSLGEASAWSGQKQSTLLKVISLMTDPARQASAAKFVGGALEFRGSPATVRSVNSDKDPNNNIQADRNGIIPGTVWRGTDQDNQFIISNPPGTTYIRIRPGGAASLNLPKPEPKPEPEPANRQARAQLESILPNRRNLYESSTIASANIEESVVIINTTKTVYKERPAISNGGYFTASATPLNSNIQENSSLALLG